MGDLSRNECHCDFMFVWLYGWMLYNDPFSQSSKDLLYNRLFCFVLCFWSILRETLWSGAAKPPHIYWPAFLKLKIESWETHYTLYNLLCIVDFVCIWEVLFAWGGEAAPYTLPFLLETRNGWFIQKRVIYGISYTMILSLNLIRIYYTNLFFGFYCVLVYIERYSLVGTWYLFSIFKEFTIRISFLVSIVFWFILRDTLCLGLDISSQYSNDLLY